ncbi:MAG: hypothetical protein AB1428_05595 [Bacteroidota bacterium]
MAKLPGGLAEGTAAPAVTRERRYIYGSVPAGGAAGYAIRPNRKAARRTVSTFNIILLLFGLGGAIVLYISNTIAIERLSLQVEQAREKLKQITDANNALKSEIDTKSAADRIYPLAATRLGLHPSQRQIVWFPIDWDKARTLGVSPRPGK